VKSEWVYGIHAVQAILKSAPQRIEEALILKSRDDQRIQKILQQIKQHNIPVVMQSRQDLDELCGENHQGVVLRVRPGKTHDEDYLWALLRELKEPVFLLILDGITDPHNLGACMRTADAAGVHAVIVPKDNSAGMNDTVRKVACGAAETVPLIPVTNLARTLKTLQEEGVWLVGTAGEADLSIFQAPLTGALGLIMGAEGTGMRRLTREHCDHLAYIPMAGSVSSLNVSVATGVCLFEAVRQRVVNK
jgi:23S rRNA (guanosine2251-2'-O)-methyltransferase